MKPAETRIEAGEFQSHALGRIPCDARGFFLLDAISRASPFPVRAKSLNPQPYISHSFACFADA
jgi:hypothetical protein